MPSYLSNLNMNGFEVKNFLIDKLTAAQIAAIGAPVDGRAVYDTTNNTFQFRENGSWKGLGLNGLLPLSQLTDHATADLPLLSGGGGGDPHYAAIDLAAGAGLSGRLPLSRFVQAGTSGQPLLSAGNAADAAYGALDLANANAITGDLPLANLTDGGTAGQPLLASGGGTPAYGALDLAGANSTTGDLPLSKFAQGANAGYPLLAGGTGVDSAYGQLDLGGAGVTGTLPLAKLADGGTAGYPLLAGGGGGDPAYGQLDLTAAVSGRLPLANFATGTSGLPLLGGGGGDSSYAALDLGGSGATGTLAAGRFPALTGDVTTSAGSLTTTVATVGGAAAADVADAVTKRHTQNTDTGTTSQTFQLQSGSSGFKMKNAAGEAQVRNAADTDFASLRVKDLIVEGTQTIVNSNTVSIADNLIEINGELGDPAGNSSGGFELRRLGALSAALTGTVAVTTGSAIVTGTGTNFDPEIAVGDGIVLDDGNAGEVSRRVIARNSDTELVVDAVFTANLSGVTIKKATPDNAKFEFNISTARWQANYGVVGSTQTQRDVALKIAQNNSAGTQTVVTHNFNSKDVVVQVFDIATGAQVIVDVTVALNTVTVDFGASQSVDTYRIVVIG